MTQSVKWLLLLGVVSVLEMSISCKNRKVPAHLGVNKYICAACVSRQSF